MGDAKGISFSGKPLESDGTKVSFLDELLDLLRKLLERFLNCVTCGCYSKPREDPLPIEVYEAELMEEERNAVSALLKYLDSEEMKNPTINEERRRALCVLTYSGNEELQRSAALCFAELSDRMQTEITPEILEPLVILLKSRDQQVQKAASLATSNFALNGPDINRALIVKCGALAALLDLMKSENIEVLCNACGCITTLATNEESKRAIVDAGGIAPILLLARSVSDVRVQRNACGALLNLTHLESIRSGLVQEGALPVLVEALHSRDADVNYYSAAALSNLAVNERHRAMMVAIGHYDVIKRLLQLLRSKQKRVRYQACLALRNLASDGDNQIHIVKLKGLPKLHDLVKVSQGELLTAALACLRNLSIHKANEAGIIAETFLSELRKLVVHSSNPEAQAHAAGTIRNLAAGEEIQKMSRSGCLEALITALLDKSTNKAVLSEVTAALAVLADEDVNKRKVSTLHDGEALDRLISLAVDSDILDVRYNCAGTIGQLVLTEIPSPVLERCQPALLDYLEVYLHCEDDSFVHIALWTLLQLITYENILLAARSHNLNSSVRELVESQHSEAIKELADTIRKKMEEGS